MWVTTVSSGSPLQSILGQSTSILPFIKPFFCIADGEHIFAHLIKIKCKEYNVGDPTHYYTHPLGNVLHNRVKSTSKSTSVLHKQCGSNFMTKALKSYKGVRLSKDLKGGQPFGLLKLPKVYRIIRRLHDYALRLKPLQYNQFFTGTIIVN